MQLDEIIPSIQEFIGLVTEDNFEIDDIQFQRQIALEVGFKSWAQYLNQVYQMKINNINLEGFASEFIEGFNNNTEISGSFPLLINKYKNRELISEGKAILEKVNMLPENIKNRIDKFENKLHGCFLHLILEKNKNNQIVMDLMKGFQQDFKNQLNQIDGNPEVISDVDPFFLPNVNAAFKKHVSINYYFSNKTYLLEKLYDELLALKYIEPNVDFIKSFASKIKPPNIKATLWKADVSKLLYLLFKLNNKVEFHSKGERIDKIACQLFQFEVEMNEKKLGANYNKSIKKFNDQNYINKKMGEIENIFSKISS